MSKNSSRGKSWDELRLKVLNRDGWTCAYCGKHLEGADATADHIVPKELGGLDELSNLVAACRKDNGQKQDKVLVRMPYVNREWLDAL